MKIKIQLLYRFIFLLLISYRFFDATIEQVNNSFSVTGIFFRVCYLNDGHTILFIKLNEQIHDLFTLFGIQVTCRFISQNEFGFCHQRPCNAHELLLTSGKLSRE